jgi:hypothetical protein
MRIDEPGLRHRYILVIFAAGVSESIHPEQVQARDRSRWQASVKSFGFFA